ncbi:alpha-ketoglutarate-dependent dioxygenase alkB homolog 6 [Teleopsis dalmanni]|uniref:alpha-ketoglutarate-dependent dioxygenase alkB homolog 6 n=1 Tax=Teleopsis dalmanni TaxID=139649 RepID=UPI000D32C6F0|nr:alpha-ketoglutarate-dependent dioxygenase alkB homolog 6 [Teleopsis dalmanni]
MDFTNFVVRTCPPTITYIPNFITSEEEQHIMRQVEHAPKPKWTQLLNRRLINYGGVPHSKGMVAEEIPQWLQTYVDKINNFGIFETEKANHVLVNEYLPGQGIMAHTDGPLFYPTVSTISCGSHTVLEFTEREKTPTSRDCSNMTENEKFVQLNDMESDEEKSCYKRSVCFKLLLEPRSLLILKDLLYTDYLHAISESTQDVLCDRIRNYENCETVYKMGDCLQRGKRISLTIRNVPKTTKMKLKFC